MVCFHWRRSVLIKFKTDGLLAFPLQQLVRTQKRCADTLFECLGLDTLWIRAKPRVASIDEFLKAHTVGMSVFLLHEGPDLGFGRIET